MIVHTGVANNFLIATDCIDCVPPEVRNYSHEQFTWEDQAISIISARFASQMRLLDWVDGYTIQIGDTEINEVKESGDVRMIDNLRIQIEETIEQMRRDYCFNDNTGFEQVIGDGEDRNRAYGGYQALLEVMDMIDDLKSKEPAEPIFTIETDGTHWAGRNERGEIEVIGYSEDDIMEYVRQHDILPYRVDYRPVGYSLGPS